MQAFQLSDSKFQIFMSDSLIPVSGKTGLTVFTVFLCKAGQAEAIVTPTIQERGHGWYEVTPTTAMRDTLGESAWTFVAAGALDFPRIEMVIEDLNVPDSIPAVTIERSTEDTNPITFAWPVDDATITGQVSKNNGAYAPVAGAIAFLRSESGKHYYTLAYDEDDRLPGESQIRYRFDDGIYTRYVNVRLTECTGGGGGGGSDHPLATNG